MASFDGRLEAYWEQGWEGMILFCFMPEVGKERDDIIPLENGHQLTIFDSDGSILWQGTIQFKRRGMFDRHKLHAGIWSDTKQKGVSYADWMDWFWRKPPLKAKLEIVSTTVPGQ